VTSKLSLQDQIDFAEKRVHIDQLHLKMRIQGMREAMRAVVSSRLGLGVIFLATGVVGAFGGRKLIASRRAHRSLR